MRRDTYYAKYYGKGGGWPLGIKNKTNNLVRRKENRRTIR